MYRYVNSNNINGKKLQHISNGLPIFLLIFTIVLGSTTSSFNVYGQSNETNSTSEDVAEIIPDTPLPSKENDKNIEQFISENVSKSGSSVDND
jgi:hypothetical protein